MNTFISQKLGEVLAFARIGDDTLKKGREGFLKMLDEKEMEGLNGKFTELGNKVADFASKEGVGDEVEKEAKETEEKVRKMRDMYIDGNWNEESEVLEWMGFYTGAALVHWYLISGAGKSLGLSELESISKEAIEFYNSLFVTDEKTLQGLGASQSKK